MGQDDQVMPLIDMANVACGFHASDPNIMHDTVVLAAKYGVSIGAHPSYQDLQGFGRRSIPHSAAQVRALIWYQLGALEGICRAENQRLAYVKPHGALNNDMIRDPQLLEVVMEAIATYQQGLPLMIPVSLDYPAHRRLAERCGVPLIFEAFADRAYDDTGRLVSRREPGAVHQEQEQIVDQALSFAQRGGVHSITGHWLELPAESLCVHGDGDHALAAVRAIRAALTKPAP